MKKTVAADKVEDKKITNKEAIEDLKKNIPIYRENMEKFQTLLTKAVGALEVLEQIED